MAPPTRRRACISSKSRIPKFSIFTCLFLTFLIVLSSFVHSASAAGSAVLGIDIGTEYLKAALVKPGIPLEIVLTKDSKRKESAAVAFKPTRDKSPFPERFYGGDALALAARYPDDTYMNLKTLLGIPFNDGTSALVQTFHGRYPSLRLESAPGERGGVGLRSNKLAEAEGKHAFLIEELLAMQLKQVMANAETLAGKGSDIRDAVITYPAFYTADEKRSLELAAELAGLDVEAFVSDGLAIGLNFATSRTFPSISEGQNPEYHVVYDMGAGSTTATVLRFQSRTIKDVGRFNKTVQEIQVMGAGWDRTLGGDSLNELLMNDMVQSLAEHKDMKGRVSISTIKAHGKTIARLWKDAEKIRQILSANTETGTSFEGLFQDDVDFRYKVSRSKFEDLAVDYAKRVRQPLERALAAAGLTIDDIDSVILHGGAVRTPFVQKELEKVCGSAAKLRTNVNADEAAVFGVAFKGAALSPNFRVKDIRAADAATYSVSMKWNIGSKERQQKLFTPTSSVGSGKQVTIKSLDDFEFSFYQQVPQGDDSVVEAPVLGIKTLNLTASVSKLKDDLGCLSANITTKFTIRLSPVDGLPEVLSGSVNCEVESQKKGSIVEDVKGLFGLGSKKGEQEPLNEEQVARESITLEGEETSTQKPTASSAEDIPHTSSTKSGSQKRLEIIPIGFTTTPLGMPPPELPDLLRIKARLAAFDASDRERVLRAEALNELESFVYRSRDLVDDEEFVRVVKDDQLNLLRERVSATQDWLYEAGDSAETVEITDRLESLKDIVNPALGRKKENAVRPSRVQVLQDILMNAKTMTQLMEQQIKHDEELYSSAMASSSTSTASELESSSTGSSKTSILSTISQSSTLETPSPSSDAFDDLDNDPYSSPPSSTSSKTTHVTKTPSAKPSGPQYSVFHPSDLSTLNKTYESINFWLESQLALQEKLTESDNPALTVSEIDARLRDLERVMTRIYDKMGVAAAKAKAKAEPHSSSSSSPTSSSGWETASSRKTTTSTPKTSTKTMTREGTTKQSKETQEAEPAPFMNNRKDEL